VSTSFLRLLCFPAVLIALFALVMWQVVAEGTVYRADERLGSVLRHGSGLPEAVTQLLADLGDIAVAVPVLAAAVGWAALRGRRRALPRWWLPPLAAALAMAAVPAVVAPLQSLVGRPGPPGAGPGGYFPSGHAATAATAFGATAVLLLPALRTFGTRLLLGSGVLLLNAAVGAGLVVRGYHWPLDVLGSWLLSGALLAPVTHAVRVVQGHGRPEDRQPEDRPGDRGRAEDQGRPDQRRSLPTSPGIAAPGVTAADDRTDE
jgi:undecaprenyl-diphosphatase